MGSYSQRENGVRAFPIVAVYRKEEEGRVLLCGIAFALLPPYTSLRAFLPSCPSHRRGQDTWKGCGQCSASGGEGRRHEADHRHQDQQRGSLGSHPTGHRLAACFFKAPDETPEEVEHMGYPQLLHLYPPEEILVGPGIAPEEVEEIFVEA